MLTIISSVVSPSLPAVNCRGGNGQQDHVMFYGGAVVVRLHWRGVDRVWCQKGQPVGVLRGVEQMKDWIICLRRQLLPLELVWTRKPSPPAPRSLCSGAWWPTPSPPGPETGRTLEHVLGEKAFGGALRRWRYLSGVDRDGLCHEALEVAAQTDAFHADQRLLRQHRPKHTPTTKWTKILI